jgi:hypothetical protein
MLERGKRLNLKKFHRGINPLSEIQSVDELEDLLEGGLDDL